MEPTDDIVTWLRRVAPLAKAQDPYSPDPYWWSLTAGVTAAADEIERLRADRDKWRKISDRLISGAEQQLDEWRPAGKANTNDAWMSAWHEYDKAVGDEYGTD